VNSQGSRDSNSLVKRADKKSEPPFFLSHWSFLKNAFQNRGLKPPRDERSERFALR
jgi:hypothetical protein